jgi:4-carboxymuconolactone decarboxylase
MTISTASSDRFAQGLSVRREVLGRAYVDESIDRASRFSRPVQDLVTEFCWGAVWARPGLDRRTRSLVNVAMLTALNRGHELGVHVRAARTNGASVDEIQEVLLQTAVYVGFPAALESFRIADRVLNDVAEEQNG